MRKFIIPALAAIIIVSYLTAPTLASALPAPVAMPANTASPRDWEKYAPNGELDPTKIAADSAILIDATTGKVLFHKDENTHRYPASTTKVMTCLLTLENCKDLSTQVTIGTLPNTDFINHSENIGLKKGEKVTVKQLLYALMVYSGNDAADALAQYIGGGNIDDFVAMMNQKAQELGMANTHYTSANGLADDTNHYTTASDMAKLASVAVQNPDFVKIVSTPKYTMAATNKHPDPRTWTSTDYLISNDPLYSYVYATGIKTGYTSMAGNALVSSAKKGGISLIGVVLHDEPREKLWTDSITMFEYGFKFYDTVDLVDLLSSQSFSEQVKNAADSDPGMGKVSLLLRPQVETAFIMDRTEVIANIKNDPATAIKSQVSFTKDTAPINRNDVVGTVTFSYNNSPVLVCDLLASRDVAEMPAPTPVPSAAASAGNSGSSGKTASPGESSGITDPAGSKRGGFGSVIVLVGIILLVLVLAMVIIRIVNMQRRNRKYRGGYNYRQGGGAGLRR